jgi:hypothetical protein
MRRLEMVDPASDKARGGGVPKEFVGTRPLAVYTGLVRSRVPYPSVG